MTLSLAPIWGRTPTRWGLLGAMLVAAACTSSVSADGLNVQARDQEDGDSAPSTADTDNRGDTTPAPTDTAGGDTMPSPGDTDTDGGDRDDTPKELVHAIGRFDRTYDEGPIFEWSATNFVATFEGTGIAVTLDGHDNWFEVYIDGERDGAVQWTPNGGSTTQRTITLASGLSAGTHTVQIYRRTEAHGGDNQFLGFEVQGGALVPSPFPFSHRLEFIGDSITCGYGIEGDGPTCGFTYATENGAGTYAAQTARNLDAASSVVAWSGKGMLRDYAGGMVDQMPVLYDRAIPTNANSTWDFQAYVPDAIVIDLGTNDWSGGGNPGDPYVNAYVAFTTRLRTLYPHAEIFCAMGPMQNSTAAHQLVKDAVAQRNQAGDTHIHYVRFDAQDGAPDLGCGYHPGASTNAAMAEALTTAIHDVLGW